MEKATLSSNPGQTRILEVAGRLFAERGYSNVSIRDVCKGAGTTAPMIYYYFGSKRGLFEAVTSRRISMKEFISRLRGVDKEPGRESITKFVTVYLTSFPAGAFDPGLYLRDTAKLESDSTEKISRDLDEVHGIAADLVRRGMQCGVFRRTDPAEAADCLIGMLNHIVFQRIHFAKLQDLEIAGSFITDFFLRGMR